MMEFENTSVSNFESAFRGMRNPLSSWSKSDSVFGITTLDAARNMDDAVCLSIDYDTDMAQYVKIGPNDMTLAKNLIKAGSSDSKFLRSITVSVDITAPCYIWHEVDTYKVGTTRNSCSMMHKGASRDYRLDDFTIDDIVVYPMDNNTNILDVTLNDIFAATINNINELRRLYKETKDYKYFRALRQLMPMGYNYRATLTLNYAVISAMYHQRKHHRLEEWSKDFCQWVETLPYAKELIIGEE